MTTLTAAGLRRLTPSDRLSELRGQVEHRTFEFDRASADEGGRSVWMSISSEAEFERWWGVEVLDHDTQSIKQDRLRAGLSILVDHDRSDLVGVADQFDISRGRLRVLARFGKSARAEEVWNDVLDGVRRFTSVGYVINDLVLERQENGLDYYRVTDWMPFEASVVSIPADISVGVGRSAHSKENSIMNDNTTTRSERRRENKSAASGEHQRVTDLLAAGDAYEKFGGKEIARELIDDPVATVDTFRARILDAMGSQKPIPTQYPMQGPTNGTDPNRMLWGEGGREILAQPKHFTGPGAEERAFRSGQWLRAQFGSEAAQRWCKDHGMEIRAMSSAVLSQGGHVVPDEMSRTIIDLADTYGAFRGNGDAWPMNSSTLTVPRSTSDPEATFIGESDSVPESDPAGDTVTLSAKKIGALTRIPTELMEDSVVDLADRVAFQLARAFSKKEDQCGFNGDGTSTFGGMQGIFNKLESGNYDGSVVTAAANHDTFAELDSTDLASVIAALPEYALEGAKWYVSGTGYGLVFARILLGLSGNSAAEVGGKMPRSYAGYPIVTSPVLPAGASTDYSDQIMLAFGNLSQSSKFGARRDIRIQILTERYADNDQIGVMGTERFDIVNHDLGDGSDAGPMIGLKGN